MPTYWDKSSTAAPIMLFFFLVHVFVLAPVSFGHGPETSSNFSTFINGSGSYSDAESYAFPYWDVVLWLFPASIFVMGLLCVNEQLNFEIKAYYVYELGSFQFLKSTAEALHLFDDGMEQVYEKMKDSLCLLKRFNLQQIKAESTGHECSPPKFLAEEEQMLLQSDKVHVRALRKLPYLAYGIISVNKNDILEATGASHSKLWWKARVIERAENKGKEATEQVEEEEDQVVIPSKIKLCHLLFAPGGAQSLGMCLYCFPSPVPSTGSCWMSSILNGCIYGKKRWPERLGRVEIQRNEFFRQTYEFVERREGFRRRSLVLLGDHRATTPIAEALEKQPDSTFVAGFQVPEGIKGILCWKKNLEKENFTQEIRFEINKDKIPVITTGTWVEEDLRNSELAPLVIFVGWMKIGKKRNPCKECELTFDAELESQEPETAAEELRDLWEDFQQGHQWIPTQWLSAESSQTSLRRRSPD